MKPPPVCKAFVICEHVLVDSHTNQVSAVNILETIQLASFPATLPSIRCFLMMTEGLGEYKFELEVRRVSDDVRVFLETMEILRFHHPFHNRYLNVKVNGIPIHSPDRYDFIVLADDQEVQRQTLTVY